MPNFDRENIIDLGQLTAQPAQPEPDGVVCAFEAPFTIYMNPDDAIQVRTLSLARGITKPELGSRLWKIGVDERGRIIVDFLEPPRNPEDPVQLVGPDAVTLAAWMMANAREFLLQLLDAADTPPPTEED